MNSHSNKVLVLALCGLAACSGTSDRPRSGWQASTDTLGDTVVVRTTSGSVWGDTAVLVAEVTIGALEGADEYVIGDPRSIAVDMDGRIYVLDAQVPVLRSYSPDGTHLHDIGRKGGGPGEYEGPDGLAVLPDGRILIRDPANRRISVFDGEGEYLTQWPLSGGFNTDRRFYVDTLGQAYVSTLLERGTVPWEWRYGVVRYSADGVIIDTIPAPTWDYEQARVTASRERSSSSRLVPFSPAVVWSYSPLGYMVGGLSTEYRVDLLRTSELVLRIERDWAPVPVNPEEANERRRRITLGLQRQYGSWRWNGPDIPGTKPPFRELFLSWEGDVWVLLSTEGVPTMSEAEAREEEASSGRVPLRFRELSAFDVFAADGRYLGHVRVPDTFRVEPEPIVRDGYVWAVTRDELDVATIVRFRVETGGSGEVKP